MNTLIILILLTAWTSPLLAVVMHKGGNPLWLITEALGSILIPLLCILLLIWPLSFSREDPEVLRGLAAILIYPTMIGYALIGFRSIKDLKNGKGQTGSWSYLVLFLLAGILGVILGNDLSIILISWLLIIFTLYKLITYKDLDLEARQDYRERLDKDYLDRF